MFLQSIFYHLTRITFFLFITINIGFPQSPQGIASKDIPVTSVRNQNDYINQVNFNFSNKESSNGLSTDPIVSSITSLNYYWWMIISGEKSSDLKNKLLNQLAVTKKEITEANNDVALIFLLSFELRVHFYYKELFSVFLSLSELNRRLTKNEKIQGSLNNEYFTLVKNLVNYMNASINDKYPFYYKLLIHQPCIDKKYSIEQLKRLTKSKNNIVSTESNYFLMKIYFENEHDFQSAEKYARSLAVNYPGNFIFSYYYRNILIGNQNFSQAEVEKIRTIEYLSENINLTETQKKYCISLFQGSLKH